MNFRVPSRVDRVSVLVEGSGPALRPLTSSLRYRPAQVAHLVTRAGESCSIRPFGGLPLSADQQFDRSKITVVSSKTGRRITPTRPLAAGVLAAVVAVSVTAAVIPGGVAASVVPDARRHPSLLGGAGMYKANSARGPFVHVDVRGSRARWGIS